MPAQLICSPTMSSSCHLRKMVRDPFFWCWEPDTSKVYMRCNFRKTRPCILHILPHETSTRAQMHAYNAASARIRTWLNALWRVKYCEQAYDSMPFTHRSMPTTRPFGMYMAVKNTHILTRQRCFGVMYLTFLLTLFFTFSANPITKNRH